ncbi:MAG: Fic family protein [Acidobacteriota bacterium]
MNSVTRAQKELAAIHLTPEQKQDLDRWVEVEFVCATLGLEGVVASSEEVARVAAESAAGGGIAREDRREICDTLKSINAVRSLAANHGTAGSLTPSLLIELHDGSRPHAPSSTVVSRPSPEPAAATLLLAKLESACHWFAADSFIELHPAEQAAIVLMRLIELKPFEEGNKRTALAASSLFTLRSGFPPIIISPSLHAAYRTALNEGMKMNTKPMVDLVAQALVTTIGEMIERVRSK